VEVARWLLALFDKLDEAFGVSTANKLALTGLNRRKDYLLQTLEKLDPTSN
jgi:hypothetical protein